MAGGPLQGKTIVFGVTGGIAVYKAVDVVSRLRKAGADVYVIMTRNATRLVQPITFRTISNNPVVTEMFEEPKQWNVEHIALAERAELFMVCPATANVIGKVASGIADDFLTTTIMATEAPVLFVPAMNNNMYENPITQKNIGYLQALGYHFMEPDHGRLASGKIGKGRFPEPERIVAFAESVIAPETPLAGKTVLVTAGPTREALDPVRYLTNHSSGKMGYAIAAEAHRMGAQVLLVTGPTSIPVPVGVKAVHVTTGLEMRDAVMAEFLHADIAVMAAAVSDYRPGEMSPQKIKKSGESLEIKLVRNPDILYECGQIKKATQVLVGFAAETQDLVENATAKVLKKNADMIVANDVSQGVFGSDYNKVVFVYRDGTKSDMPRAPKTQVAREVLMRAARLEKGK